MSRESDSTGGRLLMRGAEKTMVSLGSAHICGEHHEKEFAETEDESWAPQAHQMA